MAHGTPVTLKGLPESDKMSRLFTFYGLSCPISSQELQYLILNSCSPCYFVKKWIIILFLSTLQECVQKVMWLPEEFISGSALKLFRVAIMVLWQGKVGKPAKLSHFSCQNACTTACFQYSWSFFLLSNKTQQHIWKFWCSLNTSFPPKLTYLFTIERREKLKTQNRSGRDCQKQG